LTDNISTTQQQDNQTQKNMVVGRGGMEHHPHADSYRWIVLV
jgi:hypothetical protein